MATSNFGNDEVLGVIALNTIDYAKREVEYYRDEEGIEDFTENDIEWDWYYQDWQDEIDRLNDELSYIRLELEGGYYEGAMLRLVSSEKNYLYTDDLQRIIESKNNKNELTAVCRDVECYNYGISPSKVLKDYEVVVNWINERLKSKELLNLGIAYRCSNGETGYYDNEILLEV